MQNSTQPAVTSAQLARLLKLNVPATAFLDRLKIRFRPYVCPFELLLPHIEPGLSYFDIGCGSGMFLRILAEYKSPVALGGAEVSQRLIQNAAALLETTGVPVSLSVYQGGELPLEIGDYRWVFLIDVLHHIPRHSQFEFLVHLYGRLKPGQRLLFKDIDAASPFVYFNKLHDLLLSREIVHERSATTVKQELKRIGFDVSPLFKRRVLVYPHYAFLCSKPSVATGEQRSSAKASGQ
jgi:2-polyprenyl-3-methyl-5-hydroxy-6-metoxy-1,4-benzoquinol methylase